MKITVLSGSPKGELSITLQYIQYIIKKHPEHEYAIHLIGSRIHKIERDEKFFKSIIGDVASSDVVLWATPVYYMTIPSQLMRFIELIYERGADDAFKNRYAASLTTSIHFFDHTAHNYLHAVSDDLGMKYVDYYSAYMDDLLKDAGQKQALLFAENLFETAEKGLPYSNHYHPSGILEFEYTPAINPLNIDPENKRIVVIADSIYAGTNLDNMIKHFCESFTGSIEVIDLRNIEIKSGCIGCIRCSFDNRCTFCDEDGFYDFYEGTIKRADAIVFAGTITHHFLSSRFKKYLDRSFYNNHVPSIMGKQIGFIVSGRLRTEENLREIFKAYFEIQTANLVDFVTDEDQDSRKIDESLQCLASDIVRLSRKDYLIHRTFISVGGWKLFRDEVWGKLRFVFQADHKFYEENGLYDFPQDDIESLRFNEQMIELLKDPKIRDDFRKNMRTTVLEQYKKAVESA